jgi:hypothetical protein
MAFWSMNRDDQFLKIPSYMLTPLFRQRCQFFAHIIARLNLHPLSREVRTADPVGSNTIVSLTFWTELLHVPEVKLFCQEGAM